MSKPIAIFGAGGLGREVLALVQSLTQYHVIGFFDDNIKIGTRINGVEILGDRNKLRDWPTEVGVILAMGMPAHKQEICFFLKGTTNLSYPILVHPRAIVMDIDHVEIEEGSILTAGSIITTNVKIGKHVLINLNSTIGHDSIVKDFSSIMPGVNLAGGVKLGEAVLIGSGANILGQVVVGEGAVIGAGSVVNRNVNAHETAVGVPARAIVKKL